jgi:hypothetical protein
MSDRRDPTKSAGLRKRGRTLVARRVFNLHRSLRGAISQQDAIGLRGRDNMLPGNIVAWLESNQNKLARGEMMIRQVVGSEMTNPPNWLWQIVGAAVYHGVTLVERELKSSLDHLDPADLADVHGYAATAEVVGIAQDTERRLIRHAVKAVEKGESPEALMREVLSTLEKITKLRLNLLVNTGVVRAVNHGKLFAYAGLGVRQVGIDPEWVPAHRDHGHLLRDAKRRKKKVEVQTVAELLSAIGAISEEQERATKEVLGLEEEEPGEEVTRLVNVLTAGDDRVCDDCDAIATDGPYEIDEARDLIPAHPNCRCAFVPFGDKRFAPIVEQEDDE